MPGVKSGRVFRQWLLIAGTLLMLALVAVSAAMLLRAHQTETSVSVRATLSRKALAVEEQLNRQLLTSDQTLRILADSWERDPTHFQFERFPGQMLAMPDTTLHLFIVDAAGVVRQSTRPEIVGANVVGRDYFRHEQSLQRGEANMFVGVPVQGLVTRSWQLNLARRLQGPDGSFGGVIAATLSTTALDAFADTIELGNNGLIALLSLGDGGLLSQSGAGGNQTFKIIAGSPLLQAAQNGRDTDWVGSSPNDGITRIHAFAPLPDRNMVVLVGIELEAAMQPFYEWRTAAFSFAALTALFLLACSGLLLQATHVAYAREDSLAQEQGVLRTANAALEEARGEAQAKAARLQAALSGMSDGIMMLDAQMHLLEWNRQFVEFTGVPDNILRVGLPMRDILRAQAECGEFGTVDPDVEADRRISLLQRSPRVGTLERLRPNGRLLEIRRNVLPGGGFVTLYADVTERRVAAERLHQAQTMAAVGRLTAGLAHDFNNLLASITLNAEMLEIDLEDNPTLMHRANIILQATQRGAALVHQLLAFSRKQDLVPQLIHINATIEGMREIIRTSIGSQIRLQMELQSGLWPVLVDLVQIENVILNLVINARDAMPEGGVLTMRSFNHMICAPQGPDDLAAGDYVTIDIGDNGTGMSEEVRRNAFDPFFTTKAAGKGSGLGLSQVYGVTRQSGGRAEIISALGEGTTIRIILPRAFGSDPEPG